MSDRSVGRPATAVTPEEELNTWGMGQWARVVGPDGGSPG